MSSNDDIYDPKSSKVVKSILTASGKKSKNRRISWGGYNKQHYFTLEGHLYDVDVPMNETQLLIAQADKSRTAEKDLSPDEDIVEPKADLRASFSNNAPAAQTKEPTIPQDIGQSFTYPDFSKPKQSELPSTNHINQRLVGNEFNSPGSSPVKFKISDTPLLKPLNPSQFFDDNEDMLDDLPGVDLRANKIQPLNAADINKGFDLDSTFMKDLFVRSERNMAVEVVNNQPPISLKPAFEEQKNKLPQSVEDDMKALAEIHKPSLPVQKRLSFSVKNILDEKNTDLNSYLPVEAVKKVNSLMTALEKPENAVPISSQESVHNKENQPNKLDENNNRIQEEAKEAREARETRPSLMMIQGLFSEPETTQTKDINLNFTQDLTQDIQKNRRLSSTVHDILVEVPPSSIKKVEQSNFSLEQDDLISNLIKDKPLHALFQDNDCGQPLTTSLILNQSFEDKLNKYMSPQKKTTNNPNIHLSKSPLLESPKYGFDSPPSPKGNPAENPDEPGEKRRLTLNMKFDDSKVMDGEDISQDFEELHNMYKTPQESEIKAQNPPVPNPKYPFTELKTIPECSDSFGESDAKKSMDHHGNMASEMSSANSTVQNHPNPLLDDPKKRASLRFNLGDDDDEMQDEDDDVPFVYTAFKGKSEAEPPKNVVATIPAAAPMEIETKKHVVNPNKAPKTKDPEPVQQQNNPKPAPKGPEAEAKAQPKVSLPAVNDKKTKSPSLKRKEHVTDLEEVNSQLKKVKVNPKENPDVLQVETKPSPAKPVLKGVLKNGKKNTNANTEIEVEKKPQGDQNNRESLPAAKEVNAETGGEDTHHQKNINNLIVKSPRINKLQKRFLIDFLSPRDSSINQSSEVPNPYALLDKAPVFKKGQVQEPQDPKDDNNSFNNILKRNLLLKCKSCYDYAQKVKLLKEQLHDLEYNISALDDEIKAGEEELDHKKAETQKNESVLFEEFNQSFHYDKIKYALVENLQVTLSLFGYSIKTTINTDKGVVYRIKFDNNIIGIAVFEFKAIKAGEGEYILNEFTLIDGDTNYKKGFKGHKVLSGEEVTFDKAEIKTDPRNAFTRKNIIDLVYNEMTKCFNKKAMKNPSSLFIFTSFRIRSYFYLLNTIKQLATSQIIDRIVINYDTFIVYVTFRFRYLPKTIVFSLNLQRSWWNDFEVLWEANEKLSQNLVGSQDDRQNKGSKQDDKNLENRMWDSTKIKLKTLFNSEINKRTINKFENIVNDILAFKWISV